MKKAVPTPKDVLAIMVWEQLDKVGVLGLSVWEMQKYHLPELTKSQIKTGIDHINHVLQQTREAPLVCFHERGRSYVWRLPEQAMEYHAFALRRMKGLMTRTSTEMTRAEAAVLKWPDEVAPYLPKMIRRVIEDIEDIVVELGVPDGEG